MVSPYKLVMDFWLRLDIYITQVASYISQARETLTYVTRA